MRFLPLTLLLPLLACAPADDDDGAADETGAADGSDGSDGTDGPVVTEPPPYSQGDCPTFEEGANTFATGETTYTVHVWLPDDPAGAPLLTAWHWLGGSARSLVNAMDLEDIVDDHGVILVAADSDGSQFEWHFLDDPAGNPDLLLFEDLVACAHAQWAVDLDRVYATGMSAGGLWTSYLTMHAAEWLAATAPMSGGIEAYTPTAAPIPAMLTWGGPSDLYSTYSFEDATLRMSDAMVADDNFVVLCEHDDGHTLAPWGTGPAWEFLAAHPKGVDPWPWADGLPEGLPDGCRLP